MVDDQDTLQAVDVQEQKDSSSAPYRVTGKTVVLFLVAALVIFVFVNSQISARSAAGYTGFLTGGSCCSSEDSPQAAPLRADSCCGPVDNSGANFESLRQAGLDYYRQLYGDDPVEAVVEDYGCHQEIHIYRDGELLNRLIHLNGKISEL